METRDKVVPEISHYSDELPLNIKKFENSIVLLERTNSVREVQSILRDKATDRESFVFNADRLIRLVIEEGLNQLPQEKLVVECPTGQEFDGLQFIKGNCGISVIRSGESMERGLRQCCRNFRIGKILIQPSDEVENNKATVIYAKMPKYMQFRRVLLMYPILNTGTVILEAIKVLQDYNVKMENVILLTLTSTPEGLKSVLDSANGIRIVTSEINKMPLTDFAKKYFGTE